MYQFSVFPKTRTLGRDTGNSAIKAVWKKCATHLVITRHTSSVNDYAMVLLGRQIPLSLAA